MKLYFLFGLIIVFLSACSIEHKMKRENKKYDKFSSGIRYSSYRKASVKGMPQIVEKYNSSQDDNKVSVNEMRAYMGFVMILAKQNRFAAVESDLIMESNPNDLDKFSANNLQASVKYNKEWEHIANAQFNSLNNYYDGDYAQINTGFGYFASELILANMHIRNNDFKPAVSNLSNIATLTGVDWPRDICSILAQINNNELQTAQIEYKKFMQDDNTPDKVKEWFGPIYTKYYNSPEELNNIDDFTTDLFRLLLKGKIMTKSISSVVHSSTRLLLDLYGGIR